jgi:transcriptional/translational regulatory protein YebC/TACO1
VASIRHAFSKYGGNLGTNGSVDYMFERKGQFIVKSEDLEGRDLEELELELIDAGLDSIEQEDDEVSFYTSFEDFAGFGPAMEKLEITVSKAELVRIPTHTKKLSDSEVEEVLALVEKLEEDDDVSSVFHTMDESE